MLEDLFKGIFLFLALEGRLGGEQDIEDDSAAPQVTFACEKTSYDLRRHIADCPYQFVAFDFGTGQFIGCSKVEQLDFYLFSSGLLIEFCIEDNIFEFDISMHNMQFVQVVDASKQLFEYDLDHVLVEVLSLFDEVNY